MDLGDSDEIFAWEAISPRATPAPRPALVRMAAFKGGMFAGAIPGAFVMLVYYAQYHHLAMPWLAIAGKLALYAPMVGVLLAIGVEGVAIAIPYRPLVVLTGGLAGAIAGIGPGAFGITVFGKVDGPFIGTALAAISICAGAFLVAVPAAQRERASGKRVALAVLGATAILGLVAAALTPLIVADAFHNVRGALDERGMSVGGAVGALAGGILGLYASLVVALARTGSPVKVSR